MDSAAKVGDWWGSFEIQTGQVGLWRIGPLSLWIERSPGEWRFTQRLEVDLFDTSVGVDLTADLPDERETDLVHRFGFSTDDTELTLTPLCADRHVISRPDIRYTLPPGEESVLFVGTPLWVRIEAGKRKRLLADMPIVRPSDTWFGASTREGHICYASRTRCRVSLDGFPFHPRRGTTAVTLQNHADRPLDLERLNLPVVHLGLHRKEDGNLWTDDVRFERTGKGDMVELRFGDDWRQPPANSKRVAAPRDVVSDNLMLRAFSSLFE
jgi:hypothetical protein